MKWNVNDGAITVFLSIIVILMLCIACSTVEATRVHVGKMHVERALNSAMNSVLAEYDNELMDEYGIIGLDTSYGKGSTSNEIMQEKLTKYLNRVLNPEKDLDNATILSQVFQNNVQANNDFIDMYRFDIKDVEINNINGLLDENTKIIKHQIIEDMKYRGPLMLIETFLDKLDIFNKSVKTTKVVNEKDKVEKQGRKIENQYTELMKLIDGIKFKDDSPVVNKGKLVLENSFIKQLVFTKNGAIDKKRFTNHEDVNKEIVNNLYIADMNKLNNYLDKAYKTLIDIYIKDLEIEEVEDEIDDLSSNINSNKEDLKNLKEDINDLLKEREELKDDYEQNKNDYKSGLITYQKKLISVKKHNIDAKNIIQSIQNDIENFKGLINEYENTLNKSNEEMIGETYKVLKNNMNNLKNKLDLKNDSSLNKRFNAMKKTLDHNIKILDDTTIQSIENFYDRNFFNSLNDKAEYEAKKRYNNTNINLLKKSFSLTEIKKSLLEIEKTFLTYSIDELILDYKSFTLSTDTEIDKKQIDPRKNKKIESITKTLEKQKPKNMPNSQKSLDSSDLPSSYEKTNKDVDMSTTNINMSSPLKIFNLFNGVDDEIKKFVTGERDLYSDLLINEYIMGNFRSAVDHLKDADKKTLHNYSLDNHFLNYEVEYILFGKHKDQENFNTFKKRLMLIRIAMNFIHILSAPEKKEEALSLAIILVGWSPFNFLVNIVQNMLMFVWSLAESWIDVNQLLEGKRVAFFKTSNEWALSEKNILYNILNFSVDKVNEKSNQKTEIYINKAVNKMNEKSSQFLNYYSEKAKKMVKDSYIEVFEEAYRLEDSSINQINTLIDSTIESTINSISEQSTLPQINDVINYSESGSNLLREIQQSVNYKKNIIVNGTVQDLHKIKNEVLSSFHNKIQMAENNVKGITDEIIDSTITEVTNTIQNKVSKTGDIRKEHVQEKINDITNQLKKRINAKMNTKIAKTVKTKVKPSDKNINISFSYEDYLRINLILFVKEKNKLYRTMDCVQINKQQDRGKNFQLKNLLYDYEVTTDVEMDYLFFKMPFMPKHIQDFGRNHKHKIKVKLSHAY